MKTTTTAYVKPAYLSAVPDLLARYVDGMSAYDGAVPDANYGWTDDRVEECCEAAQGLSLDSDAFREIATLLGTDHPEAMSRERTIVRVKELLR